jgi:hypothetical protein
VNQDKLDKLYALATDERTPEEERRTSAVLYLKHAPKSREPTKEELRKAITKDMFHELFAQEIAEHQRRYADVQDKAEKATKRAEKAESELRELKETIRAARAANEKVEKLVAGEAKKEATYKNVAYAPPFDTWDLFQKVKP